MKRSFKWLLRLLLGLFFILNFISFFHAYKFTHFSPRAGLKKSKEIEKLSVSAKLNMLFFGFKHPRPVDAELPSQQYETVILQSNKKLECWSLKTDSVSKGTVIIFHGYGGNKSDMIDKSDEFLKLGYNTLLVDFMGSGGSEGNETTIGVKEAEEVKTCYDHVARQGEQNIFLFGTSMGAAAILKAMQDYELKPKAILIECPFGTMYQTVCARFRLMHVPSFPMAGMLMFWGGTQNGFWAFSHNPVEYAKAVKCPAMLLWGEKDDKVSKGETDEIFSNLKGPKTLTSYPNSAHENYLKHDKEKWITDVTAFMKSFDPK